MSTPTAPETRKAAGTAMTVEAPGWPGMISCMT
jgi:hypothetical protein